MLMTHMESRALTHVAGAGAHTCMPKSSKAYGIVWLDDVDVGLAVWSFGSSVSRCGQQDLPLPCIYPEY